jgi:hypothetical protein
MPRIVCMGCEKEIGLAEIPFCADCVAMMDPAFAANREIEHSLGHLKGAKDHMKNSAGNCVSWCPACSAGGKEVKP